MTSKLWKRQNGWINRLNKTVYLAKIRNGVAYLFDGHKHPAMYDVSNNAGWRRIRE